MERELVYRLKVLKDAGRDGKAFQEMARDAKTLDKSGQDVQRQWGRVESSWGRANTEMNKLKQQALGIGVTFEQAWRKAETGANKAADAARRAGNEAAAASAKASRSGGMFSGFGSMGALSRFASVGAVLMAARAGGGIADEELAGKATLSSLDREAEKDRGLRWLRRIPGMVALAGAGGEDSGRRGLGGRLSEMGPWGLNIGSTEGLRNLSKTEEHERVLREAQVRRRLRTDAVLAEEGIERRKAMSLGLIGLEERAIGMRDPLGRGRFMATGERELQMRELDSARQAGAGAIARARAENLSGVGLADEAKKREIEALTRIIALDKQHIELVRQGSQIEQDRMRTEIERAKAAEASFKATADAERERLKGGAAEFGRLSQAEQQELFDIATKLKTQGVQALNADQLEKADRFGIFGNTLRDQFADIGERAGHGRLAAILGEDIKGREAERQAALQAKVVVDVTNKLQIEIKNNEQLIDQLMRQLIPLLKQSEAAAADQAVRSIRRELGEQDLNRRAGGGGGP